MLTPPRGVAWEGIRNGAGSCALACEPQSKLVPESFVPVENRKSSPATRKTGDLAGRYGRIGIAAVTAAAQYAGDRKAPRQPMKSLRDKRVKERPGSLKK